MPIRQRFDRLLLGSTILLTAIGLAILVVLFRSRQTINVNDLNEVPTEVTLSPNAIDENTDTSGGNVQVGVLATVDEDTNNTFTYSLVAGTGSTDNGTFVIAGDKLNVKQNTVLDFEAQDSYPAVGHSLARFFRNQEGLSEITVQKDLAAAAKGIDALKPWNLRYLVSGDVTREQDPYFPFAEALGRWGRSFAALGIEYRGAELARKLKDYIPRQQFPVAIQAAVGGAGGSGGGIRAVSRAGSRNWRISSASA